MTRTPLIALLCGAALAGCVTAPDLGPAPRPRQAADLPAVQSLAAPQGTWPAADWWTRYGDAQLEGLIGQALADAPSMALARGRLERARALADQADAARAPTLSANTSISESKPSYDTGIPTPAALHGWNDSARVSLDFAYEIDFWGKNRRAVAAAASEARASEADLAAARLALSTAVAAAYADLVRLYADRDALVDTQRLRDETLALVRQRYDQGYDSESELRQALAGPPAVRAEIAATDEQIGLTKLRLGTLTGAGPDAGLRIGRPAALRLRSFGLPANLPAELMGRRPDIVAARWRVEASRDRMGQAQAQFYPNINLIALIGSQTLGVGNLLSSGSTLGSIGPAVNLPLFDGGRRGAGLKVARADYDASVAVYDAALGQALEDVAGAALSSKALEARLAETRAAEAENQRAYVLAKARYASGASDYLAVLVADERLLASRRQVAALESRRFVLDVNLVRALGGGDLQDPTR